MPKRMLVPPKNFRRTKPKCCLTCKHRIAVKFEKTVRIEEQTFMICERDGNPREDEPEFHVCDYWKEHKMNEEK